MNPDVPRVPRMYHVCDTRMCVVMCDSWKFPLIPTNFRRVSTNFRRIFAIGRECVACCATKGTRMCVEFKSWKGFERTGVNYE